MTTTTTEGMTTQHVEALLALLVSLDPRLRAPDEPTAAIRVKAWTTLLGEVAPSFAVKYAEHSYQEVRDWPLAPAEILTAWRTQQREEAEARGAHLFGPGDVLRSVGADPVMVSYLRDCLDAIHRGEDVDTVPVPETTWAGLTPQQDAWQRRCTFHRICACDHRSCRDGILDVETVVVGFNGLEYPAVERCPFCKDAIEMAVEQGLAKKPGQRPRRRAS